MATISVSHYSIHESLAMAPAELIHSQSKTNEQLRSFLVRGRELSNPDPAYIPYFFMLSQEAMDVLLKKIKTINYVDEGMLGNEHHHSSNLYLIYSGKVHVNNDGYERTYHIRESFPGHAEFAVLMPGLVTDSVIGIEKTEYSMVNKLEFINWLMSCPDVSFGFLGALSDSPHAS